MLPLVLLCGLFNESHKLGRPTPSVSLVCLRNGIRCGQLIKGVHDLKLRSTLANLRQALHAGEPSHTMSTKPRRRDACMNTKQTQMQNLPYLVSEGEFTLEDAISVLC